ncbi:MAG: hypothetical protein AAF961_08845, partial [Planctomycetota bacterium]
RYENLQGEEIAKNLAAVQGAIDDMNRGDVGRNAREVERALRGELKLPRYRQVTHPEEVSLD